MKKRVIALVCLLAPGVAWSMTMSDIEHQVRRYTGDTSNPKIGYTSDYIYDLANEIQREVVNQTWCLTKSTAITLVAGTTYYDLPNDLIAINQVVLTDIGGTTSELEEVLEKSYRQENPDYEKQHGEPTQYFVRFSTTTDDPLEMAMLPAPATSSTGTIRVDYYQQVTDMAASTDVPFEGLRHLYPYHQIIVYGVVARLKLLRGDTDGATAFTALYTASLQNMISRLGQVPNYGRGFQSVTK